MLQALLHAGIVPDVLIGCSVGALNAAFIAAEPTAERADELAKVWRGLSRKDVFGTQRRRTIFNALTQRDHLYENSALRRLISRFCPVNDLADLAVETHIVTTDLEAGRPHWWSSGPAQDVLAASASLPAIFPPVSLPSGDGTRKHVDGGVVAPIPIDRATSLNVKTIYVLDVAGDRSPIPTRMSALGVLVRSFAISRYANLPDPATLAREGQEVVVLPCPDLGDVDIRDFEGTSFFIDHTRALVADFLEKRMATMPVAEAARPNWLRRHVHVRRSLSAAA
jgi:NTE family protein